MLVVALTIAAKDRLQAMVMDGVGWRPALLVVTAHDPQTREPLFTEDDIDALGALPADLLEPVVDAALQVTPLRELEVGAIEGN